MFHRSFIAHDQPPAVIHPPETAFDFPALAIPRSQLDGTPALRLTSLAARNGRDGRLDAPSAQLGTVESPATGRCITLVAV